MHDITPTHGDAHSSQDKSLQTGLQHEGGQMPVGKLLLAQQRLAIRRMHKIDTTHLLRS